MSELGTKGLITVISTATISICFSLMLVATYLLDSHWREEFRNVKNLLLALSICTVVESIASLFVHPNKTAVACDIQGCLLMMSLTATFLYEAAAAVEMCNSIDLMKTGESISTLHSAVRVKYYHAGIILFVTTFAVIALANNDVDDSLSSQSHYANGNVHCHYTHKHYFINIAIYIPALISVFIIIISSIVSWNNLFQMIKVFMPTLDNEIDCVVGHRATTTTVNGGDASGMRQTEAGSIRTTSIVPTAASKRTLCNCYGFTRFYQRLDQFTKNNVLRMMCTPLMYIGVLVSVSLLIRLGNNYDSQILALDIAKIVPALNTVMWIWTDTAVMQRWKHWITSGTYELPAGVVDQRDSIMSGPGRGSSMFNFVDHAHSLPPTGAINHYNHTINTMNNTNSSLLNHRPSVTGLNNSTLINPLLFRNSNGNSGHSDQIL